MIALLEDIVTDRVWLAGWLAGWHMRLGGYILIFNVTGLDAIGCIK